MRRGDARETEITRKSKREIDTAEVKDSVLIVRQDLSDMIARQLASWPVISRAPLARFRGRKHRDL